MRIRCSEVSREGRCCLKRNRGCSEGWRPKGYNAQGMSVTSTASSASATSAQHLPMASGTSASSSTSGAENGKKASWLALALPLALATLLK